MDLKSFCEFQIKRPIKQLYICYKKKFHYRLTFLCDISELAKIPASTMFHHPIGIVIRPDVQFGENCRIMHNVTIGKKNLSCYNSKITIGNNVFFGAGSSVIADNLTIGDNAKIGAGAIVLKDVPAGATITGVWK